MVCLYQYKLLFCSDDIIYLSVFNITSPGFLNLKWVELFVVLLSFFAVQKVNGQQLMMTFERNSEVIEEGSEFLAKLTVPDQYAEYEVLWNAPADWYVNGEPALYKDHHNDTRVVMEAGSASGMVSATLYKKDCEKQGGITFYTYFTVIPSGFTLSGNVHLEQEEGKSVF